ncbi:MAG: Flp1 family type IVb pilin [Coprococcus comes]
MLETVVTPSIHAISRHGARFMVVIIGLVIIFKKQLNELVTKIFEKITNESSGI